MSRATNNLLFAINVFSAVAATSCSFNFELTSQRTALENQILGNYKELDDDLIVANYGRQNPNDAEATKKIEYLPKSRKPQKTDPSTPMTSTSLKTREFWEKTETASSRFCQKASGT